VSKLHEVNKWKRENDQKYYMDFQVNNMINSAFEWLQKNKEDYSLVQLDSSFFSNEVYNKVIRNIWIGDSGASCHMSKSNDGYTNYKIINSDVK
jgi:hypothetical protein